MDRMNAGNRRAGDSLPRRAFIILNNIHQIHHRFCWNCVLRAFARDFVYSKLLEIFGRNDNMASAGQFRAGAGSAG
jgi:hypothetical protein